MGPTVWELDGPMPILKRSKTLTDMVCGIPGRFWGCVEPLGPWSMESSDGAGGAIAVLEATASFALPVLLVPAVGARLTVQAPAGTRVIPDERGPGSITLRGVARAELQY
ncbi:hypothetical protein GmRootA79_48390 [Acidovorax sp. A79]